MSCYIAFEGPDGCGKTTQAKMLEDALTDMGSSVKLVHQPGGTLVGDEIRRIVKDHQYAHELTPYAERLLFKADDMIFMETVMQDALHAFDYVIADRYSRVSNVVYGAASGVSQRFLSTLDQLVDTVTPSVIYLLNVTVEVARLRQCVRQEAQDRIEAKGDTFTSNLVRLYEKAPVYFKNIYFVPIDTTYVEPEALHRIIMEDLLSKEWVVPC